MKNIYHSTRNEKNVLPDYEAILKGIADDGGLFVMDNLDELFLKVADMMDDTYLDIARNVLGKLLPHYTTDDIQDCVQKAYGHTFEHPAVVPIRHIQEDFILELFHGPTCAFKDVGLQMLPQLMSKALEKEKGRRIMILTATSGDTGKAALEGFRDVKNTAISVFYPNRGVSSMQRLQMVSQEGNNVAVCAVDGNFDDAQSQVKELFSSEKLQLFEKENITFSSANSINIGRLIPQVVYYFDAYRQLVKSGTISIGEEINFCVPTGNFGNVLAGYYAKLMGLPVHRFLVASNANHVLTDFLKDGRYDRRRDFHKTISPSMDILISSNLERLLYYMGGKDCAKTAQYMRSLQAQGYYQIDEVLLKRVQQLFYGGCSTDEETKAAIAQVYRESGYVMDPHTAVGYKVMKEYQKTDSRICVLLATASPYKFADQVYSAIFHEEASDDEFEMMKLLHEKTKTEIPEKLLQLKAKPKRFDSCVSIKEMETFVIQKTKEIYHD